MAPSPRSGDPRTGQIVALSALLAYGALGLDLEVRVGHAAAGLVGALAAQWLGARATGLPRCDLRSPLISALSLGLLLRGDDWRWALAAGALAVGSKFLLRRGGKHFFNPTNFALVGLSLAVPGAVWVSPGQWGSTALLAAAAVGAGSLVVQRAERADVTWAFLAFHAGGLAARAAWLGDPLAIPLHQLANGTLLVFAFHMLSDPRSTPDSRAGRVLFAAAVAALDHGLRFGWWADSPLLVALFLAAPWTPLLDALLPGERFAWRRAAPEPGSAIPEQGDLPHATPLPASAPRPALAAAGGPARAGLLRLLRRAGRRRGLQPGVPRGARP